MSKDLYLKHQIEMIDDYDYQYNQYLRECENQMLNAIEKIKKDNNEKTNEISL